MTELLPYNPTTANGTGLLPPLTKASVHTLLIYAATVHEWPMTNEQAAAELGEAIAHLAGIPDTAYQLLSTTGRTAIDRWTELTTELHLSAEEARRTDAKAPITNLNPKITEHAQQTYALLSLLDTELTGLRPNQTDPGRLP